MSRATDVFRVVAAVLGLGAFHLAGGPVPLACASPTVGLVSWWPADGNAMDIAGGNNGAPHSGVTFAPGVVGQAFSFDGQRAGINVPNANPGCGIGNHSGFPTSPHNHPFQGLIDELQIYHRALSASEVQALYSAGAAHRPAVAIQNQLVLFPNPVPGGLLALGEVILAQPADAGGVTMSLSSSNPAAAVVPAAVTVLPGASAVTFPIVTFPVAAPASVVISAGGAFGAATATLQVLPLSSAVPPVPPAANLLVNGSFEEPQGDRFGVGDGVPGWRIVKGTIDVVTNSYWQAAPDGGNQSIDLDGTSVGTIEQSFATVPGHDYLFSGYVSHNPSVPYGRANVFLNGVFFTQLTHDIPNRNPDMQWRPFTYRFRATAAVTTLTLSDVTGINDTQGTVLDGLSVTLADGQSQPLVTPAGSPNTAPAAPTGLAVTAVSAHQVALAWMDNSSNETAFAIWRKTANSDWTRVGVAPPNTTSFTDSSVIPSTTYTYRVRAANELASDWSNEVTVTTLAGA